MQTVQILIIHLFRFLSQVDCLLFVDLFGKTERKQSKRANAIVFSFSFTPSGVSSSAPAVNASTTMGSRIVLPLFFSSGQHVPPQPGLSLNCILSRSQNSATLKSVPEKVCPFRVFHSENLSRPSFRDDRESIRCIPGSCRKGSEFCIRGGVKKQFLFVLLFFYQAVLPVQDFLVKDHFADVMKVTRQL